jgi:hypothetical protein
LSKHLFSEVTEGFSRVYFDSLQDESFCKAMTPMAVKALHSNNGENDNAHKITNEADMIWMKVAVHATRA